MMNNMEKRSSLLKSTSLIACLRLRRVYSLFTCNTIGSSTSVFLRSTLKTLMVVPDEKNQQKVLKIHKFSKSPKISGYVKTKYQDK